jgi:hypothetical protein
MNMKAEYKEGAEASENFEKLARAVFQTPNKKSSKKQPKKKAAKRRKSSGSDKG